MPEVYLLLLREPIPELPGLPVFASEMEALRAVWKQRKMAPGGWAPPRAVPGLADFLAARLPAGFVVEEFCYLFGDLAGRDCLGHLVRGRFPQPQHP